MHFAFFSPFSLVQFFVVEISILFEALVKSVDFVKLQIRLLHRALDKMVSFCLFSQENLCCRRSLEASQ